MKADDAGRNEGVIARVINLKVREDGQGGVTFVGSVERRKSPWGMCGSLRKLSFDCFYFVAEIEKKWYSDERKEGRDVTGLQRGMKA